MTLLLNRPKDKSANEPKYPEVSARAASVVRHGPGTRSQLALSSGRKQEGYELPIQMPTRNTNTPPTIT
jgi:hypothetical protein